jgi:hypothetical protein
MSQIFFIAGLPRSRTSWLANLLTWECAWSRSRSHCFHDALKDCASVGDLVRTFERLYKTAPGLQYAGDADSGLCYVWRQLLEQWPAAKLVVVLRPHREARASFERYFAQYPYINMPRRSDVEKDLTWGNCCRALGDMEEGWPAAQRRTVLFEDFETEHVVRMVWDFCLPGMDWNHDRWELLHQLRINPASEKIALNLERIRSLTHNPCANPTRNAAPASHSAGAAEGTA